VEAMFVNSVYNIDVDITGRYIEVWTFTLLQYEKKYLNDWETMGTADKLLTKNFFFCIVSSPCQRQCELLPSLGIRRLLTIHILIFSSEIRQMN
jgi:hypothetical protein